MHNIFVIRDEEYIPLLKTLSFVDHSELTFHEDMLELFSEVLPNNTELRVSHLKSQLEEATNFLNGRKSISLDPFFNGDYSIRTSRLFTQDNDMSKFIGLVSDSSLYTIEEQIERIPSGNYVIVEDDSVAYGTIREYLKEVTESKNLQSILRADERCESNSLMKLLSLFHDGIVIEDIYIMATDKSNVLDTVDLRDFMFGVENSGVKLRKPTSIVRAPYVLPFVNIASRASIPDSDCIKFSERVCDINKKMFSDLGFNVRLADMSYNFIELMREHRLSEDMYMTDVCDYIKSLVRNVEVLG